MVWICELVREWTAWQWLCKPCAIARRSQRNQFGLLIWAKVTPLRRIEGRCFDCERQRQASPGYVTPTPNYVTTSPGTVHPAAWKAA